MLHILQRHRDILQDYSHEFQKTKSNIMALREREELLGSVKKDIDAFNKQGDHCGLYLSYPHPPPFPKAFTYSMANFKFLSHSVWPGTCLIGGEGESSSNSRVHIEHAC